VAVLLDVSKDIVARHKKHMYNPPRQRRRRARSLVGYMRSIMIESGMPAGAALKLSAREIRRL
jgi:hypothetical protein